ncbi:RNA polymerase sigma factor [Bremerella sp.]|uniref:RNA polymerase sigma factor n=1 Tax=Bremerella sp. TaxID=2795602 RepID=UPI00391BAA61
MNDSPSSFPNKSSLPHLHGQAVWGVIVRVLGTNGHDAADCFQQTFLEFIACQQKTAPVRSPEALLKKIATARAIDMVRKQARERKRTEPADPDAVVSQRLPRPESFAEAEELREDLRLALAAIKKDHATAFVLTAIENMTTEEAATSMGITVNHVRVLLHRARNAMQLHLASHAPQRRVLK